MTDEHIPRLYSNFLDPLLNPSTLSEGDANKGIYWTANHDARPLEANSLGLSPDDILGLTILYNMRSKDGRDFLKDIFKKYMDTLTSAIGHLAQASMGGLLAAYGSQIQIANLLEHNYMTATGTAGGFQTGFGITAGTVVTQGFLGQILGTGYDVNQTLILAGVGVPQHSTTSEIAELLAAAKGRGISGKPNKERRNVDIEPHSKQTNV